METKSRERVSFPKSCFFEIPEIALKQTSIDIEFGYSTFDVHLFSKGRRLNISSSTHITVHIFPNKTFRRDSLELESLDVVVDLQGKKSNLHQRFVTTTIVCVILIAVKDIYRLESMGRFCLYPAGVRRTTHCCEKRSAMMDLATPMIYRQLNYSTCAITFCNFLHEYCVTAQSGKKSL